MRTRRTLLACLALSATLGLGACGLTPLYANTQTADTLSDFTIVTGEERVDFLLQQALMDAMNARQGNGRFELRTQTEQNSIAQGIGADALVQRYTIELDVRYQVFQTGAVDPVLTGRARGSASYDLSTSPYAALSSEQDAEERAAQMAADRITTQLLRFIQTADGA